VSLIKVIERFGRVTLEVLFEPSRFFSRNRAEGGLELPLLYAICTHWIASAVTFGWEGVLSQAMKEKLGDAWFLVRDALYGGYELGHPGRGTSLLPEILSELKAQILTWFWGASSVLLSPFKTLMLLAWATFFLFVASRLLIYPDPHRPITFKGSLRLACFASTTVLWKLIPLMGSVISEAMLLITTVIAVQKTYQIGKIRAFTIALFPQLLFLGILTAGFFGFAWLIVKSFI